MLAVVGLLVSACGGADVDVSNVPDLPVTSADEFELILHESDRPTVVNVWASWCLPCRSEAPLLRRAHSEHGDRIGFMGVDVQDTQNGAKQFITEFEIQFPNVFDRDRSIPARYGAVGTPITFFFDAGGELVSTHAGVIDEAGLAIGIDELLARAG